MARPPYVNRRHGNRLGPVPFGRLGRLADMGHAVCTSITTFLGVPSGTTFVALGFDDSRAPATYCLTGAIMATFASVTVPDSVIYLLQMKVEKEEADERV